MTSAKRSIRMLVQLALLFAAAGCINVIDPDIFLLRKLSTLFLMGLSLALLFYFSARIIDPVIRRYLTAVAAMMGFLMLLRGAKYIAFEETELVARHLWYLYYLPGLMIPQLSLDAALSLEDRWRDGDRRPRAAVVLTTIVTAALILLVLTNDLHQLVFRFQPGFAGWDSDYRHAPFFTVVYSWMYAEFAVLLVLLLRRCRLPERRRLVWVPLVPVLFGTVYMLLYAYGLWPTINGSLFGQFPEALCFTTAGVWLGFIQIGLIPSNEGYEKIFEASDLSAQIVDESCSVVYRSSGAVALGRTQLEADAPYRIDANTRLHHKKVAGGYVYWQDDITGLNQVLGELAELEERLSGEAELLRLENQLREDRARVEAKTRLYDEIAEKVRVQSDRILTLCGEAERDPSSFARCMEQICLLATYIKRYANLSLLAEDRGVLSLGELALACGESLRCVRDMGIPVSVDAGEPAVLPAEKALSAYALFEDLLEQSLDTLSGSTVSIAPHEMRLVMEGAVLTLPQGAAASLTTEDGSSYVRISLGEGGDA